MTGKVFGPHSRNLPYVEIFPPGCRTSSKKSMRINENVFINLVWGENMYKEEVFVTLKIGMSEVVKVLGPVRLLDHLKNFYTPE